MALNIVKNTILMFVRRFYQPEITYADKLIKQWVDSFVRIFVDVVINGFIGYLFLFGLLYLFPYFSNKIFLGDRFWHFPFAVILIGIVTWFMRETWVWVQKNKKLVR